MAEEHSEQDHQDINLARIYRMEDAIASSSAGAIAAAMAVAETEGGSSHA